MSIIDFFLGGNTRVAAKSTVDIFNDGMSTYSDPICAYRYTFIFRFNTIARHANCPRDFRCIELFCGGRIINCTHITVANLNTGAAPQNTRFEDTYADFSESITKHLQRFGLPKEMIFGNNSNYVSHMLSHMTTGERIPSELQDKLILNRI